MRMFGVRVARVGNLGTISNIQISAVPREGVSAKDAMTRSSASCASTGSGGPAGRFRHVTQD
jgi:hypothetical protein